MTKTAPWDLSDNKHQDSAAFSELSRVIFTLAEALRISSILLQPYMPQRAAEALDRLGVDPARRDFGHAVRGADAAYGMSLRPRGFEGKGAEKSLFPPLGGGEFPAEEGEPLAVDRDERKARREAKLRAKEESRARAREARKKKADEGEV